MPPINFYYSNGNIKYTPLTNNIKKCNMCGESYISDFDFHPGTCTFCISFHNNCIISIIWPIINPSDLKYHVIHNFYTKINTHDVYTAMANKHSILANITKTARARIKCNKSLYSYRAVKVIINKSDLFLPNELIFYIVKFMIEN